MNIPFPIKKVTVVQESGTDTIVIVLDGPPTMPAMGYRLQVKTEASHGFGPQWVKDNLGIDPEVIVVPSAKKHHNG